MRIAIVSNELADLVEFAADEPIEVLPIAPHCPRDRVYRYGSQIGTDEFDRCRRQSQARTQLTHRTYCTP